MDFSEKQNFSTQTFEGKGYISQVSNTVTSKAQYPPFQILMS